jgi:hypothetical protein
MLQVDFNGDKARKLDDATLLFLRCRETFFEHFLTFCDAAAGGL